MSKRFTLAADPAGVQAALPGLQVPAQEALSRYNIAPTQSVAVVRNTGERQLEFIRWGLVPSWAKDPKIGSKLINARAETVATRPAFRTALRRRRCLIVADGFYLWRRDTKMPMYLRLKGGRPFAFAGLWEEWQPPKPEAEVWRTCAIITTEANGLIREFHSRMPAILQLKFYDLWLDPAEREPAELTAALQPYPEEEMEVVAVSRRVNSTRHDSADLVEPVQSENSS